MNLDIINNPNDKYFRSFFGEKNNFVGLCDNAFNKELFRKIDFDHLEFSDKSMVDPVLKEVQSDLLVKTKFNSDGEKKDCFVYILWEHKSYNDRFSLLQLLKYMVKIWEIEVAPDTEKSKNKTGSEKNDQKTEKVKSETANIDDDDDGSDIDSSSSEESKNKYKKRYLTPIIPALFYHSGKEWKVGKKFSGYFKNIDELLAEFIPDFNTIIYDLYTQDDNSIKGDVWLKASIRLMKHIKELKPYLGDIIDFILNSIKIGDAYPEKLVTITIYILSASSDKEFDYVESLLKNKANMEELYMSIANKLRKEGREEGVQEGLQEGIQKGRKVGIREEKTEVAKKMKIKNIPIKTIAEITGLSEKEIREL